MLCTEACSDEMLIVPESDSPLLNAIFTVYPWHFMQYSSSSEYFPVFFTCVIA